MSSEEDEELSEHVFSKSFTCDLITKVNTMIKKPVINFDLNQALDSFMNHLNETQQYLSHGICNVKFGEIGLFVQSSVTMYTKEIDLLWDDTMDFHMHLCSYNRSSEESIKETERIRQRMKSSKRKKHLVHITNKVFYELILNIEEKFDKVLKICSLMVYFKELKERWKTVYVHKNHYKGVSKRQVSFIKPFDGMYFPIKQDIYDIRTRKKICSYGDMYLNYVIPYLNFKDYSDFDAIDISKYYKFDQDFMLQKYLREKKLLYKEFCSKKLADDFNLFKQTAESDRSTLSSSANDLKTSVVNITRLPEQLVSEYVKGHEPHVRTLIQDYMSNETLNEPIVANQIKKGSERISNADSVLHDDSDHSLVENITNSQNSLNDSGICSSEDIMDSCEEINVTSKNLNENDQDSEEMDNDVASISLKLSSADSIHEEFSNLDDSGIIADIDAGSYNPSKETILEVIGSYSSVTITPLWKHESDIKKRKMIKRKSEGHEDERNSGKKLKKRKLENKTNTLNVCLHEFEDFFSKQYCNLYLTDKDSDAVAPLIQEVDDGIDSENDYDADSAFDSTPVEEDPVLSSSDELKYERDNATQENVQNNSSLSEAEILKLEKKKRRRHRRIREKETKKLPLEAKLNVSTWKRFVRDKIRKSKKRANFDIHEYGTRIINVIPEGETVAFNELAQGKPAWEVARLFLASLQLANTQNIDISAPPGEIANDELQLKLLSKERYHEHLNEYEAPSEQSFRQKLATIKALKRSQVHSTPKTSPTRPKKPKLD